MKKILILCASVLLASYSAGCATETASPQSSTAETTRAAVSEPESEAEKTTAAAAPEVSVPETHAEEETEAATEAEETSAEEPSEEPAPASDYSAYLGTWSQSLERGASRSVIISAAEGNTITFTVNCVYPNAAHLVGSDLITATVTDGTVDFTYKDTFNNTGAGTLTLCDGYVHANVTSNFDGSIAAMNFDADLTEHSDYTGDAFH